MVPFRTEHFDALDIQPAQAHVRRFVRAADLAPLDRDAFTCAHDGKILACFGWVEIYPHRATVWGLLSASCGAQMVALTRLAKRIFDGLPHRRLELDVDCEFDAGHRWARMLGFTLEAERLRGYRMDGGDSALYARVRA